MSEELQGMNGSANHDAIVAAHAELRALETNILLARYQFMRQAGLTFGGLRDEYQIFGYDRIVTNRQYREEYMRGGIAGRIVDAFPNATWRGSMEVIEDEDPEVSTEFEEQWAALDERLQVKAKFHRVDKLAGLSYYAVLLIGAKGAAGLDEELPRGKSQEDIIYLTPFSGGGGPSGSGNSSMRAMVAFDADAAVFEYDIDPTSERFGLPKSYTLKRTDIAAPMFERPVHWSRIIHVAENLLDDEVFGAPSLERVWNLLADLRKVTGGGAEAFWLRANQGMHLDVDKDMTLAQGADGKSDLATVLASLKEQAEAYKHQLDRWIRTKGVKAEVLGSDVANFQNPADAILTQIAGAKAIPKRILTGSEMGELASSQDRDNWKDQVNGRQTGYAGPYIVRPLVDRLIRYGYLPPPKKGPRAYEVRWPHIQTLTEQERTEGARGWASVNQTYGDVVFTDAEIREKWADKPPLTDEQRQEVADRKQEAMEQAQPPVPPGSPLDPDADLEEDDEPALKAAGGPGSGVLGHRTDNTGIAGGRATGSVQRVPVPTRPTKILNEILGGPKRSAAVRKRANIDTLRRVSVSDLKRLVTAYEEIQRQTNTKSFALDRVRQELSDRQRNAEQFRAATGDYKLSSVQFMLPEKLARRVRAFATEIPDEDLADDGREDEPHVTVKYGIASNDPSESREALAGHGLTELTLGKTSVFSGDGFEVVYVEVKSPGLVAMNKALVSEVETEDKHPKYVPHATVAYVKPGIGQKYAGDDRFEGVTAMVDSVMFSPAEGERETIDLLQDGLTAAEQAAVAYLETLARRGESLNMEIRPDGSVEVVVR